MAGAGLSLGSCSDGSGPPDPSARAALPQPATLLAGGASLVAAGAASGMLRYNGVAPGPTIRARRGEQAHLRLINQLSDATIVHWHGLIVPSHADGHPRDAIPAGASFDYAYPLVQRAGTFWYHPHAHQETASQVHRGLAGFFLVGDGEEDALALPSGPREILLLLQDRDDDPSSAFMYAPTAGDLHRGLLRGTAYGNVVRQPTLTVSGGRYRFRILNASHARVYRLALSNGTALTVIGNDGGLLPAAAQVNDVWLGVGERIDLLLDFTNVAPNTRLMLQSLTFDAPAEAGEAAPQGMAMDLLELVRSGANGASGPALPAALSDVTPLAAPAAERTFAFSSQGDVHRINGLTFDIDRVDVSVPLGQVERWTFRNETDLPHPVHVHGTHFQVQTRSGGRNTVYEYERGWKDTVLLMPLETVDVLIRFAEYRGLFLIHCHNLEHEDHGMMLNVEVT